MAPAPAKIVAGAAVLPHKNSKSFSLKDVCLKQMINAEGLLFERTNSDYAGALPLWTIEASSAMCVIQGALTGGKPAQPQRQFAPFPVETPLLQM